MRGRFVGAVALSGLIGGALDLAFAICFTIARGGSAVRMLKAIASGWLGPSAFEGGAGIAALGVVSHFTIALTWATLYNVAASQLPLLVRRPVLSGMAFGAVVFVLMRAVVVPLSATPFQLSFTNIGAGMDLIAHLFFLGIPIGLAARQAAAR